MLYRKNRYDRIEYRRNISGACVCLPFFSSI